MDILQDYPQVQFMLALHEGVAMCMADAYARLTRRPAFVEVHIAPGLGNALGMMHNARIGKTPMVVYAGQSPSNVLLQEPHLSGPLVDMARPIAKWAAQVEHAHDVPRALRRAFKIAAEPPQGPVFLALPMDVLDAEAEMDIAPTTYTNWRARPDAAGLAEVADLLVKARRPMLMVGDSVALAEAQAEVARVAELLGAPMFECYASEFNVPATPSAEPGQRRFRLAKIDPLDAGRLRRPVRRRRAGVPAHLSRARAAGHWPRTRGSSNSTASPTSWARTSARTSRCWATRSRVWPSWPS